MLELKVVKTLAAIHRGGISLALRTVNARRKLVDRAYDKALEYASDLEVMARNAKREAEQRKMGATSTWSNKTCQLNCAENVLLNARDDLEELTTNL